MSQGDTRAQRFGDLSSRLKPLPPAGAAASGGSGLSRDARRLLCACLLLAILTPVSAHQLGTAVLRISADPLQSDTWLVQAELPLSPQGRAAALLLDVGADCEETQFSRQSLDDAVLRRWQIRCRQGLTGRTLRVLGLNPQTPDAIVQISTADGTSQFHRLSQSQPTLFVAATASPPAVRHYFGLGAAHIASGLDHLLFILLLSCCATGWRLVGALTGFTLGHAISLCVVLLYGGSLPTGPVEAMIALSLSLLAAELLRRHHGATPSLSLQWPGIMALAFGLLHGLGFAGALTAIGLPEQARWAALALFNLGIEVGQLAFVGLLWIGQRALSRWQPARLRPLAYQLIGVAGVFWAWQRL